VAILNTFSNPYRDPLLFQELWRICFIEISIAATDVGHFGKDVKYCERCFTVFQYFFCFTEEYEATLEDRFKFFLNISSDLY